MKRLSTTLLALASLFYMTGLFAQVSLPPSGGNQKSTVTQQMGMVSISIQYSSPDVSGREGKIWGQLVPYGTTDFVALGFGTATAGPWRAGANENTIITLSHDVMVHGKKLPAGTYGLHMIPNENADWEVIFSANSDSWGSYFYDTSEDVLRVSTTPDSCTFQEYLTYEFTERKVDTATVEMRWENLSVPIQFTAEDAVGLYIAELRNDMRNSPMFTTANIRSAASYCLQNNRNLEEALTWSELAINHPFLGEQNFAGHQLKTQILYAMEKEDEAKEALEMTLKQEVQELPLFQFGSAFLRKENMDAAKMVFTSCREKYPESWASFSGWGLIHAAEGDKKAALKEFEKAKEVAPGYAQGFIQGQIDQLKG